MIASKGSSGRQGIIESINTPLGFFVLALLIVESFLALVLYTSGLTEEHKFYGLLAGVALFLIVFGAVIIIVWCKPWSLVYDKEAQRQERAELFGTNEKPEKNISDLKPIEGK